LRKLLVALGFVVVFIGLFVMGFTPCTYKEIAEFQGSTAEALITHVGFNPYGLWVSMLGLGIIIAGAASSPKEEVKNPPP
jgi:uncharacterized membrane protein